MIKKILFIFGLASLLGIGVLMVGCAIKVDSPTASKDYIPEKTNQISTTLAKS